MSHTAKRFEGMAHRKLTRQEHTQLRRAAVTIGQLWQSSHLALWRIAEVAYKVHASLGGEALVELARLVHEHTGADLKWKALLYTYKPTYAVWQAYFAEHPQEADHIIFTNLVLLSHLKDPAKRITLYRLAAEQRWSTAKLREHVYAALPSEEDISVDIKEFIVKPVAAHVFDTQEVLNGLEALGWAKVHVFKAVPSGGAPA